MKSEARKAAKTETMKARCEMANEESEAAKCW